MRVLILQGSPRKKGNTKQFSDPFLEELRRGGAEADVVWLYDQEIRPCLGCKSCQDREGEFGCVRDDDMQELFTRSLEADLLVFATPIYAFFATAPMKAYMDRFIYGSGKFYGRKKLPPLTQGKKCALLVTCGYPPNTVLPLLEDAVKYFCRHIGMEYLGAAAARDTGVPVFMTPEKAENARAFARKILGS